jgi:hypothetical protein
MSNKDVLTKILAIAGTVLIWLPLLAPILLLIFVLNPDRIRLAYLMPVWFFPIVLIGGLLLFWAALRARSHQKIIGWSFGAAVALPVGGQLFAVLIGLASAGAEPSGWAFSIAILVVYILALLTLALSGIQLLRDLWQKQPTPV